MASSSSLAGYSFVKTLASTDRGSVFIVADQKTKKRYVAKVIQKRSDKSEDDLLKELEIMAELNHQNICPLKEWMEYDSHFVAIMPKADYDLMDRISKNPLTMDEVRDIFSQVVEGIQHCHDNNVAHLDIKPENVFLVEKRTAAGGVQSLVGDFGSSYVWDPVQHKRAWVRGVVGTVYYCAPEVRRGDYDPFKADVWSMGVLLYVMLTGCWPFQGQTYEELESEAKAGRLFLSPSEMKNFPVDCQHLMEWMLNKNPAARPTLAQVAAHPFVARTLAKKEAKILEARSVSSRSCNFLSKVDESNSSSSTANRTDYFSAVLQGLSRLPERQKMVIKIASSPSNLSLRNVCQSQSVSVLSMAC